MNWNHDNKEKIQYIVACFGFIVGVLMCVADFAIIFPPGEIHDTTLWFLGEMIAFICAVFGISLHYTTELNNFKQEIRSKLNE